MYCPPPHGRPQTEAPRSARRATIQEPPCTLPRPRQLPQRGRPLRPRHAQAVHRPRCAIDARWPSPHHRPLRRADDARIIAPRATELHALRSAIPTRHTVMMGPWVPPPTSRAPAVPNNVGNTGPHSAGSHTEYRPQWPADGRPSPTPWMGVRAGLGPFGLSGVYQPSENQPTSRNMAVIRVASGCASMGSNR